MTTRIGSSGISTGVSASMSAPRVTAPPGRPFTSVMSAGASAIVQGAEQAMTRLPGGPILAAAFRPVPTGASPATGVSSSLSHSPSSPALSPEGSSGTVGDGSAVGAVDGAGSGLESVLSQGQNENLYWLGMQERINAESRDYSAWSNLLKARHDTVKNAIGNIR